MWSEVGSEVSFAVPHSGEVFHSHLEHVSLVYPGSGLREVGHQHLQFLKTLVDPGTTSLLHQRLWNFTSLREGGSQEM